MLESSAERIHVHASQQPSGHAFALRAAHLLPSATLSATAIPGATTGRLPDAAAGTYGSGSWHARRRRSEPD
jgi:hypothetical protein